MANPFSMEDKKFSLIMPVYKDAYRTMDRCFRDLENQDYKSFEVIIVMDGENKRAEKHIRKLKPKFEYKVFTKEWGGAPAARNYGFEKSTGDYIAYMDPDIYLYPETLRVWANVFEEHPEINRVWGMYDIINEQGETMFPIGQTPGFPDGSVWYEAFKYQNYCSGMFPIRREYNVGWREELKSLQDWDMGIRMLKKTDFKGTDWFYINQSAFATPIPHEKGISADSHANWIERREQIAKLNDLPYNDICVTSLGAPAHAFPLTKTLPADFLPMPSFKPHHYKMIYLLGFYLREDPNNPYVTKGHMDVFADNKGKNVVHWIGTDIWDLRWTCSFEKIKALKKFWKENKVIHLCEAEFTQKELAEVGVKAKVVPLPPKKLYEPMPLPDEFSVAIYMPGRDLYNPKLMLEIVKAMPDVKFYIIGGETGKGEKADNWENLGYIDIDEWMPKFSCNLRITDHDGLPILPIQFLTAGRNVVTNVPVKGAIQVKHDKNKLDDGRKEIIAAIRKAQKEHLDKKVSDYWRKELDPEKFRRTICDLLK